ncbi:hypothetical protein AMTRI_Chr01g102780 [Amborella trichopoda]|uniref:uncharacterized protein LOC18425230 isoform X1 n=1 Tax=Amborella trichopoda TaxID=13333 RepID=UPI0005D44394|nr:uncharacterized protein LOC18425230 isoform X1 [Amborella trichopoda]|eukprot:XP_011629285.1 uncharacterized protein LOC18425230 isoform X1 [Amborella trichopoda]
MIPLVNPQSSLPNQEMMPGSNVGNPQPAQFYSNQNSNLIPHSYSQPNHLAFTSLQPHIQNLPMQHHIQFPANFNTQNPNFHNPLNNQNTNFQNRLTHNPSVMFPNRAQTLPSNHMPNAFVNGIGYSVQFANPNGFHNHPQVNAYAANQIPQCPQNPINPGTTFTVNPSHPTFVPHPQNNPSTVGCPALGNFQPLTSSSNHVSSGSFEKSQLCMGIPYQNFHQLVLPNLGQSAIGVPGNVFSQLNTSPQMQPMQKSLQPQGFLQPQEISYDHVGKHNAPIMNDGPKGKKFGNTPHHSDKGESRLRTPSLHGIGNSKAKFKHDTRNGKCFKGVVHGQHREGARNSNRNNWNREGIPESKRPSLSAIYTEDEIKQWREERKKNFPTNANVEKKQAGKSRNNLVDAEAKLRRKRLKEILAKQAELGIEVAEVPPNYLSESEKQPPNRRHEKFNRNEKRNFRNKHKFQKRGKAGRREGKSHKSGNKESPRSVLTRSPTLLQKLLSKEIKRDKSHLLQVFRFMVMNSFFKEWPDKSLKVPVCVVGESECEGKEVEREFSNEGLVSSGAVVEGDGDEDERYCSSGNEREGDAGLDHLGEDFVERKVTEKEREEGEIFE